ncbi:hypothetical protein HZY86_05505 [Aerococcaceae bacterium DSM 111020]|nr:hypothetical protein [Aerococcaceae bacterium DSM 111020]
MKPILFYSDKCPDTPTFVEALQKYNIDFQKINITDSMKNLKQFLVLRDQDAAFEGVKQDGNVGVPALLTEEGKIILSVDALGELI